jgi:SpoVK/Ycf46/Vps4 family AAA+-type ATPase
VAKHPKTPRSPYDPKYKDQKKMANYPNITATEIKRRQEEIWQQMRNRMSYQDFDFDPPSQGGTPSSLSRAREAVNEYLLTAPQSVDWSDIIGNESAHLALREALEAPVHHAALYAHYGMKPPKGVLLYGPPGCGKTMFAKAAAAAVARLYKKDSAEVLLIKGSQLQQSYVGQTEKLIRAIFTYAREYATHHKHPLVIFMDECEVFLPDRTGKSRHVYGFEETNVAAFLAELDGLETLGAFTILATNRPEALDEALLRDGRCDRKIRIERPNKAAVYQIVANSLAGAPLACPLTDFAETVTECFFDPSYIIHHGHLLQGKGKVVERDIAVHFCLEHIISGAMATSVAARAKSFAFRRDISEGTRSGIRISDGISAVREIFEENKNLEHNFAIREFIENMPVQEMLEPKGRVQ